MRATLDSNYRTLNFQLNRMANQLRDLQTTAVTGKKVRKPSDDPAAVRPLLRSRSQVRVNDTYLGTMGAASDKLKATDNLFDYMENILVDIKENAIGSINGSLTAQDRASIADRITQMKEELFSTANSKIDGKYIFAGFEEQTKPFTVNAAYDPLTYDPADSSTWPISYNGDANAFNLGIGPDETVRTTVAGGGLFLGDADNDGAVDAGKVDIFAVLTRVETALRANDPDAVDAELNALDASADQLRVERGKLGNNAARVDSAMSMMEDVQLDLATIISRYEDADILKTISDITQVQTAFEAALSITAQVSRLSILNYL
jgi:flagellar hook-associated protein 3 FlgL